MASRVAAWPYYLETRTGNYFASSGMPAGVDQNTRFRIASNTKTFTSAAIMLLNQQGLLNIDDTIVSNIPGTAVPYVPATAQYDIPNEASITIRQLLSHTAGVFDVTNEYVPSTCSVAYAGQNYILYREADRPTYQFSPGELIGVDATCGLSYLRPVRIGSTRTRVIRSWRRSSSGSPASPTTSSSSKISSCRRPDLHVRAHARHRPDDTAPFTPGYSWITASGRIQPSVTCRPISPKAISSPRRPTSPGGSSA